MEENQQKRQPSKLMPYSGAISQFVQPGMKLHFTITHHRPSCAVWEIARSFWGTDPGFTIITNGTTGPFHSLYHGKLVKKSISTFCGDICPKPSPHSLYNTLYKEGKVKFEQWSILTLSLRLRAAAMGLPYAVTGSILGSSMENDNAADIMKIPGDPEHCLITALKPDISFIHGVFGDEKGNVVITPPYGEAISGAMAASKGAVVSVEKIVSTDFIKKYSHLTILPEANVLSISEVPFGAHPAGISQAGISGWAGYSDDYDFMDELAIVSREPEKFDEWLKYYILDQNHSSYLEKIGGDKLLRLIGKADPDAWQIESIANQKEKMAGDIDVSPAEQQACVLVELIKDKVNSNNHPYVLAGIGVPHLAGWLANEQLKEDGKDIAILAELGFIDFEPRPGNSFIFNHANIPTCVALSDIYTVLGQILNQNCLGVLGAAQIDKDGNINTTCIPGKKYLMGSGGANDVASSSSSVIAATGHEAGRMVEKVSYITSPGHNVDVILTTWAVYERIEKGGEFVLTGYLPGVPGDTVEEKVRAIQEKSLWETRVSPNLKAYQVKESDITRLREFDPHRRFID